MPAPSPRTLRALKTSLFVAGILPIAALLAGAFGLGGFDLGANPVEAILHELGIWALRFLLLTLAVTPLRWITGLHWLVRLRRMLGLFAFAYVALHFLTYALLDLQLDFATIGEDIAKRPYITLGFSAFLMLIPLAITSTDGWVRRLGPRWRKLHRLVYPVAILGAWHFWWQVKKDFREPLVYASILGLLLGYRVYRHWRTRKPGRTIAKKQETRKN